LAKRDEGVASRTAAGFLGGLLGVLLSQTGAALAFPFVDPTNQDTLPTLPTGAPAGTELPAEDVTGLRNQLRLTNPAAPGNPSGWTIIPRLTIQEIFTDNAFQTTSPRRFDAITVISPGIAALADTSHLQLHVDYQPNLTVHAINGSLNVVSQQLNATGLITIVPDLAFVDVRALSGVQSNYGALAGAGTLGAGTAPGTFGVSGQSGSNPRTQVQTSSAGISPYLLSQFKDYGTGKLGVSVDASHYSAINGFVANPFASGGTNSQSLLTTEQIAQFTSGEFFGRFQDAFSADFLQSTSQSQAGAGTTAPNFSSQRDTVTNQISYVINRTFTVELEEDS